MRQNRAIPRLNEIYSRLRQLNLDSLLVSLPENITYLTGYLSRDSRLLLSKKENVYITDSRYTQEAKNNLSSFFSVKQTNGSLFDSIAHLFDKLRLKNVGFEEKHFSFGEYRKLTEKLDRGIRLIPTHELIEELREIKNSCELKKIREATRITISALNFIKNSISAGKREIELAGELERFIRYEGGAGSSFDIIVASGPNSCYPHHISSRRKIRDNEPVLIDIGADYSGYKSDLTRVFFSGKITPLARKIYNIVADAQIKAINKIKPALKISAVDAAARQYIAGEDYGRFFTHNLGHGIGLEVHEAPQISAKEDGELKEGMVFTVEPAIYLPGKFGIRIEDMVTVTKTKAEVISGALDK